MTMERRRISPTVLERYASSIDPLLYRAAVTDKSILYMEAHIGSGNIQNVLLNIANKTGSVPVYNKRKNNTSEVAFSLGPDVSAREVMNECFKAFGHTPLVRMIYHEDAISDIEKLKGRIEKELLNTGGTLPTPEELKKYVI
jgi:hypothetical protein